jgi:hypothetical protein
MPPGTFMAITGDAFTLTPRSQEPSQHLAVNFFLRSRRKNARAVRLESSFRTSGSTAPLAWKTSMRRETSNICPKSSRATAQCLYPKPGQLFALSKLLHSRMHWRPSAAVCTRAMGQGRRIFAISLACHRRRRIALAAGGPCLSTQKQH